STDPVARTKSYIVISDLLLTFVADSAQAQDRDALRALLSEYGRTIEMARDTALNLEPGPARKPRGYADLETALTRQVKILESLRPDLDVADREAVDQAIHIASSVRQELLKRDSNPAS